MNLEVLRMSSMTQQLSLSYSMIKRKPLPVSECPKVRFGALKVIKKASYASKAYREDVHEVDANIAGFMSMVQLLPISS